MNLSRKLSLKATVATIVIAFPLMLLVAGSLNPQIRNRFILDRYLKRTNPDWDAFRHMHPEFHELEFIVTTQPSLFLREEVGTDARFSALQAFFSTHQPPSSIPLSITLEVLAHGKHVDRFTLSFPRNPNGSFTIGGDSPALSPRIENQAEHAGSGQSATRSESDSEGSDNPQPKSEGRSR